MSENTVFILIGALAAAAAAWGVGQILVGLSGTTRSKVQARLGQDAGAASASLVASSLVLRQRPQEFGGPFGRLIFLQDVARALLLVYPGVSLSKFLSIAAALASVAFVLVLMVAGSAIPAILAGAAGASAPFLVLSMKRAKRRRVLGDQLMDALDFLSRVLRAGHSLTTGLQMVADEQPDPIASEFRQCYNQHSLGQPMDVALLNMAKRIDLPDFSFFVTSVMIQRQTGGDLAEILDNISNIVRYRIRLNQQVRALTAEGRATGYLLSALPVVLFGIMFLLNREYAGTLIYTEVGRKVAIAAVVVQIFGLLIMKHIVTIRV